MDCRLPGSSVHGILQARVLEWVVIAFSDLFLGAWPKNKLKCTDYLRVGRLFPTWRKNTAINMIRVNAGGHARYS